MAASLLGLFLRFAVADGSGMALVLLTAGAIKREAAGLGGGGQGLLITDNKATHAHNSATPFLQFSPPLSQ